MTAKPRTTSQAAPGLRREPTQARAQQTIQILLEAAAQILDKDGEAGLTTNKVAAAAGFSIGTLYQYFPSKEVLLRAMVAQSQDMVLQTLEQYLVALEQRPDVAQMDPQVLLRQAIGILLQGFATGKGFTQNLIRLGWSLERPQETASVVRQVSDRLTIFLERIHHPDLPIPKPAQMFVLSRSVVGTMRSASLEKSPLLGSAVLEDALVQMAWALLAPPDQAMGLALGARPIR